MRVNRVFSLISAAIMTKTPAFLLPLFLLLPGLSITAAKAQNAVLLYNGIVIRHSVTIKKEAYHFKPGESVSAAPVVIEGDNITVDFNGAVIEGSSDYEHPDQFTGTGILVKSGRHITLKNITVKGFKVAVKAQGINALKISGSNFSNNFRQHLNSDRQAEDLADWQSYHHNEKDEWLRYGAGIYLRNCDSIDIHDNVITEGQCGLMMTACNDGQVYNNNFSFNSGLGIGMYRSSRNRVMNNKLDWNVRGFSDGVYYRGQDSAGLLVFEQCSNNVFAYNSVTHSGDGFFLWAGQSTMDTGEGGCNDNLVFSNDFSYAPTNAVEITFSRNKVINNVMHDCWHGVWAGFSYNTIIANNDFAGNISAIAIEHGKDNVIDQNTFSGDKVAIELWSNPKRPKDIGYLKSRDTRSMNYSIAGNTFIDVKNVLKINNTSQVNMVNNKISGSSLLQKVDSTVHGIHFDNNGDRAEPAIDRRYFPEVTPIAGARDARLPAGHPKGKKYIMMTQWGPYSFDYPILWPEKTDSTGKIYFDVMGPQGKWKIVKMKGVTGPSVVSGTVPGRLVVQKNASALADIDIEMEYRGGEVVSPFGIKYAKGRPYIFHYRAFAVPFQWQTSWFTFDDTNDPLKHNNLFNTLLGGTPRKITAGTDLNRVFGQGFGKNLPREKIATVSASAIDVPYGVYRVGVSASEIFKVYIDDKLVLENWDPAKIINDEDYHRDAVVTLKGRHVIRVVQAQYGDYGMLNLKLLPLDVTN